MYLKKVQRNLFLKTIKILVRKAGIRSIHKLLIAFMDTNSNQLEIMKKHRVYITNKINYNGRALPKNTQEMKKTIKLSRKHLRRPRKKHGIILNGKM